MQPRDGNSHLISVLDFRSVPIPYMVYSLSQLLLLAELCFQTGF